MFHNFKSIFTVLTFRHQCTKCGNSYKYKPNLNRHQRLECGMDPTFSCMICGRKFHQRINLKRHMLTIHKTLIE
jgi:uncharacterized Zn-finger protein